MINIFQPIPAATLEAIRHTQLPMSVSVTLVTMWAVLGATLQEGSSGLGPTPGLRDQRYPSLGFKDRSALG